jgi:Domain of unknown function (DUF397)
MSLLKAASESQGWRKAQRSMANGNCVEIAPASGAVAVRDSQNPGGYVLAYSTQSWRAFTQEAQQGRFDAR